MTAYVPDSGDIVWLQLSPTVGREQAGHSPVIVLSKARFNARSGLMLCVPMTTRVKNYPFEVPIAGERGGVALVDQTRSVDYAGRQISKKGSVTIDELEQIRDILRALIG